MNELKTDRRTEGKMIIMETITDDEGGPGMEKNSRSINQSINGLELNGGG